MAARTLSNSTRISNTLIQNLARRCSLNRTAGAAFGVVANRPMSTESTDTVIGDEKSIDVDRRPDTSSTPARRGRRDELPAFFSDPWDPFSPGRTLNQVLTFMDQLMDAPFSGRGGLRTGWDAREDDKSLYLKVEMPGLSKDDVKVWIEGSTLVMKGEKEEEIETSNAEDGITAAEGSRRLGQGTSTRRYSSRIEIPERGYKLDQIKAELKHGVLRVVVPKVQAEERGDVIEVQIDG